MADINYENIIQKFDKILERGLCRGLGYVHSQMCIEAAICTALGEPFSDSPSCVSESIRRYKIVLNDSLNWRSAELRAKGLRALGIAQIGSKGVVDDKQFSLKLIEKTIRILIPTLFREIFPGNQECLNTANRCEKEGTIKAACAAISAAANYAAANDACATYAACAANAAISAAANYDAANYAAVAANAAANAACAANYDADKSNNSLEPEKYLVLSAKLALEVLQELNSPGCEWINWKKSF